MQRWVCRLFLSSHMQPMMMNYVECIARSTWVESFVGHLPTPKFSESVFHGAKNSLNDHFEARAQRLMRRPLPWYVGSSLQVVPSAGTQWGRVCVFNDTAVATREIQDRGLVHRVLIVDCDVHQGNGTAEIFAHDDTVFTLSLHGEKNFPLRKYPSSLDVPLADGTSDDSYIAALQKALKVSLFNFRPDIIFYIAGADPYEGDRLSRLGVSQEGLLRDRLVFTTAQLTACLSLCLRWWYLRSFHDRRNSCSNNARGCKSRTAIR